MRCEITTIANTLRVACKYRNLRKEQQGALPEKKKVDPIFGEGEMVKVLCVYWHELSTSQYMIFIHKSPLNIKPQIPPNCPPPERMEKILLLVSRIQNYVSVCLLLWKWSFRASIHLGLGSPCKIDHHPISRCCVSDNPVTLVSRL